MKKACFILGFLLMGYWCFAQAPESFNYQAVARDANGTILSNQLVGLRISLLEGSPLGTAIYQESHSVATNDFGILTLNIGTGTLMTGNFATIEWGGDSHYIKVELDVSGGSNYVFMGTTQLVSVPYALYAKNAVNVDDADADPANELQVLTYSNDTLYLSNGNYVVLQDDVIDADADSNNEIQVLSFSNDTLYLTNGNEIYLGNKNR